MEWNNFIVTLSQSVGKPAFWVGFVLVVVFALNRFAVSETKPDASDPPVVSRSFTTRFRYWLSAVTYIGCYEFAYGILVGIGSFPALQEVLIKWIGSLALSGAGKAEIGTPAWAALAVTTLLPAAPGFAKFDRRLRDTLQRFASIPFKARALAGEIIRHLPKRKDHGKSKGSRSELDAVQQKARQLDWLYRAVDTLQDGSGNPRNASDYSGFFSTYGGALLYARQRRKTLEQSLNTPEGKAPLVLAELKSLVDHTARFLSCALLQIESSEPDVRAVLRDTLGLKTLPRLPFDFTFKQLIVGLPLILALTFIVGIANLWLVLPQGKLSRDLIVFIAGWIPYSLLMLSPSFIFAAGLQFYVMDRKRYWSKSERPEDITLALLGLFAISYWVATLPPLIGMALKQHNTDNTWVMQVLPFGFMPAVVAVAFYLLASRQFVDSKLRAAVDDFCVFAIVAGTCTWFATYIATGPALNLDIAKMSNVSAFTNDIAKQVFPFTAAVLVGSVGAFHCWISRRAASLRPQKRKGEKKPAPALPSVTNQADGSDALQPALGGHAA